MEAVLVELITGSHPMLLCVVYRPPSFAGSLLVTVGYMLELAGGENKMMIQIGELNINMLGLSSLLSTIAKDAFISDL